MSPGHTCCRSNIIRLIVLLFLFGIMTGCGPRPGSPDDIKVGMTRAEVRAQLGEPYDIQEFLLRDNLLFGPQEGLTDLVPIGTTLEEWVFQIGDDNFFVWFAGSADQPLESWTVIAMASYPVDAVFEGGS